MLESAGLPLGVDEKRNGCGSRSGWLARGDPCPAQRGSTSDLRPRVPEVRCVTFDYHVAVETPCLPAYPNCSANRSSYTTNTADSSIAARASCPHRRRHPRVRAGQPKPRATYGHHAATSPACREGLMQEFLDRFNVSMLHPQRTSREPCRLYDRLNRMNTTADTGRSRPAREWIGGRLPRSLPRPRPRRILPPRHRHLDGRNCPTTSSWGQAVLAYDDNHGDVARILRSALVNPIVGEPKTARRHSHR